MILQAFRVFQTNIFLSNLYQDVRLSNFSKIDEQKCKVTHIDHESRKFRGGFDEKWILIEFVPKN